MIFELQIMLIIFLINILFSFYFISKSTLLFDVINLSWEDKLDKISMLYVIFIGLICTNTLLAFVLATKYKSEYSIYIVSSLVSFIIAILPNRTKKELSNQFKVIITTISVALIYFLVTLIYE